MYLSGMGTTLDHCTVSGNSATVIGGGIWNVGPITLTSSTITGNSAPRGGGLYNDSGARLTGSTVTGNTATIDGGGLYRDAGAIDLNNTTVAYNHSSERGAGIYVAVSLFTRSDCPSWRIALRS